ncbi:hypothetical protein UFOVP315_29 [uncultured Caudovirales phage]|uniref:Uncharacterized protein n=1 Tax=uncultured Caudovirales phage TaxID=2100421 RepID=A0A6J5LYX8_9CAUD|nr:hypothetical protein UFOVP315_29 [uncultured Caudovirales phage]
MADFDIPRIDRMELVLRITLQGGQEIEHAATSLPNINCPGVSEVVKLLNVFVEASARSLRRANVLQQIARKIATG